MKVIYENQIGYGDKLTLPVLIENGIYTLVLDDLRYEFTKSEMKERSEILNNLGYEVKYSRHK